MKDLLYLAAIAVLAYLLVNTGCENRSLNTDLQEMELKEKNLQREISRERDARGREQVEYEVKELSLRQLQYAASEEAEKLRRQLENAKIKEKNLVAALNTKTSTTDSIYIPVEVEVGMGDQQIPFAWNDDWLKLTGISYFNDQRYTGVSINYEIFNEQTVSWAWRKRGLFGPKNLHLNLTNENPATTVNSVQTYQIRHKPLWYERWYTQMTIGFGIGVLAGRSSKQ